MGDARPAIGRIECSSTPFRRKSRQDAFRVPEPTEVTWVQEEPRNMGAWTISTKSYSPCSAKESRPGRWDGPSAPHLRRDTLLLTPQSRCVLVARPRAKEIADCRLPIADFVMGRETDKDGGAHGWRPLISVSAIGNCHCFPLYVTLNASGEQYGFR